MTQKPKYLGHVAKYGHKSFKKHKTRKTKKTYKSGH